MKIFNIKRGVRIGSFKMMRKQLHPCIITHHQNSLSILSQLQVGHILYLHDNKKSGVYHWNKENDWYIKGEPEKKPTWCIKLSSTIAGAPKLFPTSIKVGSPPVVKPWTNTRCTWNYSGKLPSASMPGRHKVALIAKHL